MVGRPPTHLIIGPAHHQEGFEADRIVYTCGLTVCARTLWVNRENRRFEKEFADWLIGFPKEGEPLFVRCPRHITAHAMREAGMTRIRANYRWAIQAKRNDEERGPRPFSELTSPYPATGPFVEDMHPMVERKLRKVVRLKRREEECE